MKKLLTTIALALPLWGVGGFAQDRPTMGWSSWNTFGVNINETVIKNQAYAMLKKKLFEAGYDHINIDDGYFGGRDATTGKLLIHPTRFPHGLAPVVRYIHTLGLKAGIYSDAGKNTCGSMFNGDATGIGVGLYGHDQQDCDFFFKELDFDFIKIDFCGGSYYHNQEHLVLNEEERYKAIATAIANTGRTDVRMNICRWDYPGNWAHDIAASWRTTGDINASWGSVKDILQQNLYLSAYCYDGHYNDMDMLEVGRGLSTEEDRTHFGMWCIMASPLLIGCDMTTLTGETLSLLRNPDLIALNQDPLCLQAYVVQHTGDTYVLVKDILQRNSTTRAVAFYNPSDKSAAMSITLADLDLDGTTQVHDCYAQTDLDPVEDKMTVTVPAHGTRIYRLQAERRLERRLYEAETAYISKYQEIYNNQTSKSGIYETGNSTCSGKAYVGWLGSDPKNDLQWRNVYSDQGGDYKMTLKYISGDTRSLTVNVNGSDVQTLTCKSSDWNTLATKTLTIPLKQGENTIRLYGKSSSSWMPNIDCMTLQPLGTTDRVVVGINAPQLSTVSSQLSTLKYYTLDGREVKHPRKGHIYIHGGRAILMK